jgi:hypothetical protein
MRLNTMSGMFGIDVRQLHFAPSGLHGSWCTGTQGCALGYRMLAFQAKVLVNAEVSRRAVATFYRSFAMQTLNCEPMYSP